MAGAGTVGREEMATEEIVLARLLRGLNHPLRRRILAALAQREGSAKTLAQCLGTPVPNLSYHLSKVLHEECGLVELVVRIPRRGAEEKVYRLNEAALAAGLATIRSPSFPFSFAASIRPAGPC